MLRGTLTRVGTLRSSTGPSCAAHTAHQHTHVGQHATVKNTTMEAMPSTGVGASVNVCTQCDANSDQAHSTVHRTLLPLLRVWYDCWVRILVVGRAANVVVAAVAQRQRSTASPATASPATLQAVPMPLQSTAGGVVAVLDRIVSAEADQHASNHVVSVPTRQRKEHKGKRAEEYIHLAPNKERAHSPTRHHLCDHRPLVAVDLVLLEDGVVLLLRPCALLHVGAQVVVPSVVPRPQSHGLARHIAIAATSLCRHEAAYEPLAALLAGATRQMGCDVRPRLALHHTHYIAQLLVFLHDSHPQHRTRVITTCVEHGRNQVTNACES